MALSSEDREQAEQLLSINQRRLRVRDRQIARHGDDTAPEIVLDAEDIRRKIAALEAILEPELPDEISGLVKRRLEDDYFIFQQTLGAKRDVAILREDVAILREDVTSVKHQQALAGIWRMQADETLDSIAGRVEHTEHQRQRNTPLYRVLIVLTCGGFFAVLGLVIWVLVR